jgi:mannose/fructose-specific phosphotransferase system component IIA
MVRALVLTHGNLGAELVKVVEMILGPVDGLEHGSNSGKSAVDLGAEVRDWLAASSDTAVILVDDYAGSCATCAQLALSECPEHEQVAVICGVNLAMLLGFVTWRDSSDYEDLVRRIINKGREAIIQVGSS